MGVGRWWWCRRPLASQGCQQRFKLIISPPLLVLAPLFFLLASLFLLPAAFPFLLASLLILEATLLLKESEEASEVWVLRHVCRLLGLLPCDRPWHASCTDTISGGGQPLGLLP